MLPLTKMPELNTTESERDSTMTVVFVLHHVAREGADDEDIKLIGVYSTEPLATEATSKLKEQPGVRDYPDGFSIDRYELDRVEWAEGFVSV